MKRELARTVIATFRTDSAQLIEQLFSPFTERDWSRTKRWLHTSGMALRFLDRLSKLRVAHILPAAILQELQTNMDENRGRMADLFEEFARINAEFQRSGFLYANLKGFTLVPMACADPGLRYQHDLDFLFSRRDAERCRQVLTRFGYQQTAIADNTWEFRSGAAEVCSMRDLYRTRAQRSVELHFLSEAEEEHSTNRLSRLQLQSWAGFEFPALSECDKLISQGMHLFKHFQTEWTRTAWLLEYATAICAKRQNKVLWQEVKSVLRAAPDMQTGLGMASLIAGRTFAVRLPEELECTVQMLPRQMRLWSDRYEEDLVFTEHPGSKLYLLLKDAMLANSPEWQEQRRRRLFPMQLPPRAVVAKASGLRLGWHVQMEQLRFVLQRLRFHVGAGLRYRLETLRWRRFVAGVQP